MNRKTQHMPCLRGFLASLILSTLIFAPMIWAADHAGADSHVTVLEFTGEDFYIPRPAEATNQEGVERLLASIDVPAELVGSTCSIAGTSANGESVHLNNFGRLRSNGDVVDILGTEDEANGVRLSDRQIVLGATVDLYNIMLPDADGIVATSVSYTVRVSCQDDTTTTTATTTTSSSTTTQPETTTTTTQPSTSSTAPPATTSTTAPTGSTTTTAPPSTSTTAPDGSTSTTDRPTGSTEPPASTPPTLANTGPAGVAGLAMAGIALLALGGGVLRAVRS